MEPISVPPFRDLLLPVLLLQVNYNHLYMVEKHQQFVFSPIYSLTVYALFPINVDLWQQMGSSGFQDVDVLLLFSIQTVLSSQLLRLYELFL